MQNQTLLSLVVPSAIHLPALDIAVVVVPAAQRSTRKHLGLLHGNRFWDDHTGVVPNCYIHCVQRKSHHLAMINRWFHQASLCWITIPVATVCDREKGGGTDSHDIKRIITKGKHRMVKWVHRVDPIPCSLIVSRLIRRLLQPTLEWSQYARYRLQRQSLPKWS